MHIYSSLSFTSQIFSNLFCVYVQVHDSNKTHLHCTTLSYDKLMAIIIMNLEVHAGTGILHIVSTADAAAVAAKNKTKAKNRNPWNIQSKNKNVQIFHHCYLLPNYFPFEYNKKRKLKNIFRSMDILWAYSFTLRRMRYRER